jgi:hypothetical protein
MAVIDSDKFYYSKDNKRQRKKRNNKKKKKKSKKMIYISLGCNCDPRIILKKKFGLSKLEGYKSCPFDLCITSFQALCLTLDNDFDNFFDGLQIIKWSNYKGDRTLAGPGFTAIKNKNGIIFNHEGGGHSHIFKEGTNDDTYFTKNDFKEFKVRYSKRIKNFKDNLKKYNKINFIYKDRGNKFNEQIVKNIIIKKYGPKIIKFINIEEIK